MSTFGTANWLVVLVGSCGILIPIFGWAPFVSAIVIVVGWSFLLSDANAKYNPDGSKKRNKHGRRTRNSDSARGVADR
jgi:hypothetical protein